MDHNEGHPEGIRGEGSNTCHHHFSGECRMNSCPLRNVCPFAEMAELMMARLRRMTSELADEITRQYASIGKDGVLTLPDGTRWVKLDADTGRRGRSMHPMMEG